MSELLQIFQNGVPELPVAVLFSVFFFGTFVSEDAACLVAGTAVANGNISFAAALVACFLGIFVGDMLLYAAGRVFGSRVFDNRFVRRLVTVETIAKASIWLEKNAATAVFLSRFVTGLRLPTYLAAGALRTDVRKFAAYFLIASAIWTPILVGAAAFSQISFFRHNAVVGLVVSAVFIRLVIKFSSRRNRRLYIGRLKRITNWEFWPIQIFYAPVVVYTLFLGFKHRSMTAFTAVNPAIPAGGFKGESKNAIYELLKRSPATVPFLLAHKLIRCDMPIAQRLASARQFVGDHAITFPVVVKPDAGERGKGVRIVHSADELKNTIIAARTDLILQEYVPGVEVSVFYYRFPTETKGHLFSMTEKQFPVLTGDGRSTVEELILDDQRAVCMAEKYFEQNHERLNQIPKAHAQISLIDIGTHSRGAIFRDGDWIKTDALAARIDDICRNIPGFYFGRFDIRAATFSDLQKGENFKIIELNGVTSESTNIYDPQYSLLDAYQILFRQWRLAFEIGAANLKLGARTTSVLELARMAIGFEPTAHPSCIRPLTTDN